MKKFRGVIDGIRQTVNSSKPDVSLEVDETLRSDKFQLVKTVRHGFPHAPTCVAYDPLQRLVAIGTKFGVVCVLGRPGVDMFISHDSEPAVMQILFVVNDGSLITICSNQTISHWSYRQKKPELLHSLQFNREGLSFCYTPYESKWLYCGTDKGNVYMLQLEKFELSGYIINWNKAMELSRRTHPGAVVHISDNSQQPNNLLIGFEAGLVVLWDLKAKSAIARFAAAAPIHTVSWFSDARSFVCGHVDGSLSTWSCKQPQKPVSVVYPHAGQLPNGGYEECRPVMKVEWLSSKNGEAFTVFTGGMPLDRMTGRMPCLSISRGRSLTVLEMEHNIVDFVCVCDTPYSHDLQEPYAVLTLLQNDLIVIDLTSNGYPCFENPYAMDVHDAPVTCCQLLADCPPDLIPAIYTIGQRTRTNTTVTCSVASADQLSGTAAQNGTASSNAGVGVGTSIGNTVMSILNTAAGVNDAVPPNMQTDAQQTNSVSRSSAFSGRPWPVTGGYWGNAISSAQTLLVTGHADGSVKFWDASGANFQILYKVKTSKIFERVRRRVRNASNVTGSTAASSLAPNNLDGIEGSTGNSTSSAGNSSSGKSTQQCDEPLAILSVSLCTDSRRLAVAAQSHVVLFSFSKREVVSDVASVPVVINCDVADEPDGTSFSLPAGSGSMSTAVANDNAAAAASANAEFAKSPEPVSPAVRVKQGQRKWPVGYQPDLVALVTSQNELQVPLTVTAIALSTHYSLLAVGTEHGIGIVDYIQHVCVACLATPDLYGSLDPFIRVKPRLSGVKVEDCARIGDSQMSGYASPQSQSYPQTSLSPMPSGGPQMSPVPRHKRLAGAASVGGAPFASASNLANPNLIAPPGNAQPSSSSPTAERASDVAAHAHSSSTSSLDVVSQEAIQSLCFYDSYARKSDSSLTPCLYVGTSLGSVIVLCVQLPEARSTQPVMVAPSNTVIRLRGAVQCVQLLDFRGSVLHAPSERWEEARASTDASAASACTSASGSVGGSGSGSSTDRKERFQYGRAQQGSPGGSTSEQHVQLVSTLSLADKDKQLYQIAVVSTEKQAKVLKLPSLATVYSTSLTETSCVLRAAVLKFRDGASVLACYVANGHVMVLSIPSLRPLLDCDVLPPGDLRTARTLQFGAGGCFAHFCSPSEIQFYTVSADDAALLPEMLATLYVQKQAPEPPKQNLISMLFGGSSTTNVDREELFGETDTKLTRGTAKQLTATSAMAGAQDKASGVAGEVRRTQMQLQERGERLGELDLKTEQMMNDSKVYSQHAHQLMMKFQRKKWYQF